MSAQTLAGRKNVEDLGFGSAQNFHYCLKIKFFYDLILLRL